MITGTEDSIIGASIGALASFVGLVISHSISGKRENKKTKQEDTAKKLEINFDMNRLVEEKTQHLISNMQDELKSLRQQVVTLHKDQSNDRERSLRLENELSDWKKKYTEMDIEWQRKYSSLEFEHNALREQYNELIVKYNQLSDEHKELTNKLTIFQNKGE